MTAVMLPRKIPIDVRRVLRSWIAAPLGVLLLTVLAACNGTAVVTLTSTPSTDTFLAYRVGLVSIQLQTSSGKTSVNALPTSTTVDLARLVNLSDVVGASSVAAGNFSQAVVTLDYSAAQIIYDNGTVEGLSLAPLGTSGQPLGQVTLIVYLDPTSRLSVTRGSSARLSLDFNLAASNVVNAAQKTVTVTPLMAASAVPIDSKVVRVRGGLKGVDTSNSVFTSAIVPFDFGTSGAGSLKVAPSTLTTYEINGTPSTGSAGLTQLAALTDGVMTESFGTLTTSTDTSSTDTTATTGTTETCSDGTTPTTGVNGALVCADGSTLTTTEDNTSPTTSATTSVSFSATQVLAGSSTQGSGFDRVSGVVTGRSGNTLTIDDGTLITAAGTNTFIFGTATIDIGANTQVTQFGSGSTEANGTQQISVGSLIYAFGTASNVGSTSVTLDASAGRARIGQSTASGLVTGIPSSGGALTLNLSTLGGRSAAAFDFSGTGASAGADAGAASYQVTTGNLDLTNATVGSPVQATGFVTAFGGAGAADFTASTLLDYTTINAELVVDWGVGTPAPFASYDTSQIELDARNSAITSRHEIQIGAQIVDIVGIASDPLLVPNATATNTVFTIGHSVSGTFENFNTYSAFITQLQTELNGTIFATGLTALGQYTTSNYTFSASSITLFLNN